MFAVLYDRHLDRVYRHLYYWVGNRADAEDLTQQVFLQAWRAIGRYKRTGASFAAWLLVIAHNAARQFHRDRKVTESLEIEPVAPTRGNDPEAEVLTRHDRIAVREAILRLRDDQRRVVMMRVLEHLHPPPVAAALGQNEGNVRVIPHPPPHELRRLLPPQR